ncbi:MAG: hypothetical protein KF791_08755 [Verrucomicrobiae bacterium]|nr:hypothetical protein [Verrucomicrobiae bacterium]
MKATTTPEVPGPGRFEASLDPAAPFTRTGENDLERLKNQLLQKALAGVSSPLMAAPIRRAANEAAAVAWLEAHPLLVFPTLFEEKLRAVRQQNYRQQLIRARSAGLLASAA